MPEPPRTPDAVLDLVRKSELVDPDALTAFVSNSGPLPVNASDTATRLVQNGILTPFQARLILQGRYRGFKLGPYKILDQIGAGGMGQVFLAEHSAMRRKVAVKVLPPKLAQDRAGVERFYREARAVAALDHPNIVRAHDVGNEKGTHFLVMEYVDGRNLDQRMRAAGGLLPVGPAVGFVVQAAAGLQHAHEKGLVHRDIKPANLLVDRSGVVKVLDMGLARFFEDETDNLTKNLDDGAALGTADYVSPEQLANTAPVDHRADIYSLGATLYHLVTGHVPFEGSTAAKLVAHQIKEPTPPHEVNPAVPEGLSEVIRGMMAKKPEDRYQTAAGVVHDLLPFVSEGPAGPGSGTSLPPIALAAVSQTTASLASALIPHNSDRLPDLEDEEEKEAAARSRRKKYMALAGLAVLVLGGGGLIAFFATRPAPPDAPARGDALDEERAAVVLPDGQAVPPKPPAPKPPPGPSVLTPAFKLDAGKQSVETAVFTPDGKYLITAGQDKLVRVWDGATGKKVRDLKGHEGSVRGLSLMPAHRLLTASDDKTVRLFDYETGDLLRTYEGSAVRVKNVAALPNGRRFITAGDDGALTLRDVDTGEVVKEFPKLPQAVYGLAVTRDGRRVVAGTWEAKRNAVKSPADLAGLPPVEVAWFDTETGKPGKRSVVPASVSQVHLSHDGKLAAFGTADGVGVFDLESGAVRLSPASLGGRVTGATFTRDERYVVATGHDRSLALFDAKDLRLTNKVPLDPGPGYNVTPAPDGKRVAAVGGGGAAGVWQLPGAAASPAPSPNAPRVQAVLTGHTGSLEDGLFTADGKRAVACAADKTVRVWDAMTGEQLRVIEVPSNPRGLALLGDDLLAVSFTPEGKVRTYSLSAGKLVTEYEGNEKGAVSVAALPGGKRFLSCGHDGTVKLWDTAAGTLLETYPQGSPCRGLAATPDGGRFAVGCADRTVRLVDLKTKAEVKRTAAWDAWRVGVSPDGAWAGFQDANNRLKLWNLGADGERSFAGPKRPVDGVAFTADGRFVLAGSMDRSLYSWETSGTPLTTATEHGNTVRGVELSPDGRYVLTTSTDQTAIVWRLPDRMLPGK